MTTPLRKAAQDVLDWFDARSDRLADPLDALRAALAEAPEDAPWSARRRAAWEDGRRAGIEESAALIAEWPLRPWPDSSYRVAMAAHLRSLAAAPSQQTGGAERRPIHDLIPHRAPPTPAEQTTPPAASQPERGAAPTHTKEGTK